MRKITLYIFFLIFSIGAAAQNVLKGRVIDERTEEPIIGAAIQVKGTKSATVTDLNGHFSVSLEGSSPYTLVVTCLGYIQQDLEVYDAASDVDILMRENSRMLNEVVVVGYGTAKARDVISSISSINKDKLEGVTGHSVDNLLEGHAAGVMVSTTGSQVGSAPVINIRGVASISSSVTPLYVVDGVPINTSDIASSTDYNPVADINPADIKSIDILKDAAASAMFGSRAAAGVVIITTNSGYAGKTKLTYDYNVGFNNATKLFKPMNALQYTDIKNRGWLNNGGDPENLPYATMTDKNGNIVSTNWVDLVFRAETTRLHIIFREVIQPKKELPLMRSTTDSRSRATERINSISSLNSALTAATHTARFTQPMQRAMVRSVQSAVLHDWLMLTFQMFRRTTMTALSTLQNLLRRILERETTPSRFSTTTL